MAELPETRRLVLQAGLDELFGKSFFSICQLEALMEIVSAPRGEAHTLLRALHCVDYSKMRPEMRERIPALVAEALKGGSIARPATDAVMADLER